MPSKLTHQNSNAVSPDVDTEGRRRFSPEEHVQLQADFSRLADDNSANIALNHEQQTAIAQLTGHLAESPHAHQEDMATCGAIEGVTQMTRPALN